MAEIDGVAYFGAGTKTFDDLWLGDALKALTNDRWRARLLRDSRDDALAAEANRILHSHHHDKIDSLTRGRSTAFAASHVEVFMRNHDSRMPGIDDVGRGDVKTPPMWHTAAKMPVARWYSDGSFHGPFPLMASSMELEKDRSFEALIQTVVPAIKEEFNGVIRYLRPPHYPYEIDRDLAARGRALFESRETGCSGCHGVYDGRGQCAMAGHSRRCRYGRRSARNRVRWIHRRIQPQSSRRRGRAREKRRLRRDAADGRLGEFPVPAQRQRADPASSAGSRLGTAEDLSRDGCPTPGSCPGRPAVVCRRQSRRCSANESSFGGSATIGTGSTPRGLDRETAGTTSGAAIRTDDNRRALIEYLKTL